MKEIRKELFWNYFFHSSFPAFSLSGDSPLFPISRGGETPPHSHDLQVVLTTSRCACNGKSCTRELQHQGLYFLSARFPCRTVQAAVLVTEQMPSSSFTVSASQAWDREIPYSLESKGVANSMGIKYPGLKRSFIWTSIAENPQQISQMIISQEPAQLIKSPFRVWAQTIPSQHTPPCLKTSAILALIPSNAQCLLTPKSSHLVSSPHPLLCFCQEQIWGMVAGVMCWI